jgi:adenine-specific DNA-methyltransferase
VRFSSLQYLTMHPVQRSRTAHEETLTVKLKNYVLLSPEAINLDDANRAKLQAVANAEPLALIEYWAVDPDYDGRCSARSGRTTGATPPTMPIRCAW